MIEAKDLNISTLEDLLKSWIAGWNGFAPNKLPQPNDHLRHQLGRWAKAYAIFASRDRPVPAAVANVAVEYVAQHYGLMLLVMPMVPMVETEETLFNLATDVGLEMFRGASAPGALEAVIQRFNANPAYFRRAANSSPEVDWEDVWNRYPSRLA